MFASDKKKTRKYYRLFSENDYEYNEWSTNYEEYMQKKDKLSVGAKKLTKEKKDKRKERGRLGENKKIFQQILEYGIKDIIVWWVTSKCHLVLMGW